jgi:hypothetical protein
MTSPVTVFKRRNSCAWVRLKRFRDFTDRSRTTDNKVATAEIAGSRRCVCEAVSCANRSQAVRPRADHRRRDGHTTSAIATLPRSSESLAGGGVLRLDILVAHNGYQFDFLCSSVPDAALCL